MISGIYNLAGCDSRFVEKVRQAIALWENAKLNVRIVQGLRSCEEQARDYAEGRTPSEVAQHTRKSIGVRGVVTNAAPGQSPHQYGFAIDIESNDLNRAITLAAQVGLCTVHGDPDHLELCGWRQIVGC